MAKHTNLSRSVLKKTNMEDENEQVPIKFTNSRENLDDFELLQLKTLTNTWQDKQLLKHWENSLTLFKHIDTLHKYKAYLKC